MYQLSINGREKLGNESLKNAKAFIDYPQTIDGVYENLEDYKLTKKSRVLILCDDIIADMESNNKLSPELFFKRKKTHITMLFQSAYTIRLNATHYFII